MDVFHIVLFRVPRNRRAEPPGNVQEFPTTENQNFSSFGVCRAYSSHPAGIFPGSMGFHPDYFAFWTPDRCFRHLVGVNWHLIGAQGVNWVLFLCFLVFFGVFNFHKFIDCFPSGRDWREYDNRGPILEFRGPDSEFSSPVF